MQSAVQTFFGSVSYTSRSILPVVLFAIITDMKRSASTCAMSNRTNIWYILGWAVIILVYVTIRLNIVDIPLDRDEGGFGYIGRVILDHGLPYKDAIDHKPPIVFYLYSVALLFVSPTARGIHVFLHVYNFVTLVAIFLLARIYFRSMTAGLGAAFVYAIFSASPVIQGFTASTEMFMLLPITLSVLFAVLAVRKENSLFAFLSGCSGALACWTKQVAVFSIAFALIYLVAHQLALARGKTGSVSKVNGKLVMWWLCGALGISLVIGGYFFFKGLFSEFFYWSFTHNIYYSQRITYGDKIALVLDWFKNFVREDFIIISIGLFYSIFIAVKKDVRGYFTFGFLLSSLSGTLPGFAYRHYFAQIAPAVSIAAGFSISEIMRLAPAKGKVPTMLLCGTLVIGAPIFLNRSFYLEKSPEKISGDMFGLDPFPESAEIARYIAENSTPLDRVFVYGSEPQILFYAQRRSATPFTMVYPLMFAHPKYKEMQELAWRDIKMYQPKFILMTYLQTSILWDGKADLFLTENLRELLEKHYHQEAKDTVNGFDIMIIYKRAD